MAFQITILILSVYCSPHKIALFHGCFYKLPIQIYHKKTFSIINKARLFYKSYFPDREGG